MKASLGFRLLKTVFAGLVIGYAYLLGLWHDKPDADVAASYVMPAPSSRGRAVQSAATALRKQGIQLAAEQQRNAALAALLARDAQSGLTKLATLPPEVASPKTFQDIFARLSTASANAANLALSLPPGQNRIAAMHAVLKNWGLRQPQDMLDWAASVAEEDSSVLRIGLTSVVVDQRQPALAAQYLNKLPDAQQRLQMTNTIAKAMADSDPATALGWLNQTAVGLAYDNSVERLFADLTARNPREAVSLLDQVTQPDVRQAVTANLTSAWSQSNPEAALTWAQTLPEAESTAALDSMISSWTKANPSAALQWAYRIENSTVRNTQVQKAITAWAQTDPSTALQATQASDLPDVQKTALVEAIDQIITNASSSVVVLPP